MRAGAREEPSEELNRLSFEVIGAAMEVHRTLGPALLESVYEEALCIELEERGLPYQRQLPIPIQYKGRAVGQGRIDLLIKDELVVDLKAVEIMLALHNAQVRSYLALTSKRLGLLINFRVATLRDGIKRVVYCPPS